MRLKAACIIGLIVLLSASIVSCRGDEVYYEFREIKDSKWSKHDTLCFNIDSSLIELNTDYDISIELANNFNYPYRNVWLYVYDNINDTLFRSYSQQYMLADEFGKWYGSGFGTLYQISLAYRDQVRFTDKQNLCIKLVHGMRDEPLVGIERIGIKVKRNK